MSSAPDEALEGLPLLAAPAEGVPEVIDTRGGLDRAIDVLAAGTGPVGIDAERASGIRYGQRAFLIQLKRTGSGIVLIDPEALPDLRPLGLALGEAEWVLHAATQDLPCLADRGMHPGSLFDTELAARMLGFERFGLASIVGALLGVRLAKEHSAVDWSQRPLHQEWLAYAALDVELLPRLQAELATRLRAAGKDEFARQEFAHLMTFSPTVYAEPWRRVQGLGTLKSRRALGRVRAMWALRDDLAEDRDVAPGRVVPDRKLVDIARTNVRSATDIVRLPGKGPTNADARDFFSVLKAADKLPQSAMPKKHAPGSRRPKADRDLVKARTLAMREAVSQIAAGLEMPHDIVLAPRLLKELAAQPTIGGPEEVAEFLRSHGARPWQVEHVAEAVAAAAAHLP